MGVCVSCLETNDIIAQANCFFCRSVFWYYLLQKDFYSKLLPGNCLKQDTTQKRLAWHIV